MMNIKIEFKGKVHKLGPGLKTFDDIHKDIQLRYSNCFKSGIVIGFIENNALTTLKSFEQLESLAQKMQGGSVKLKVFEGKNLPLNQADIGSSQYSSCKESKDDTSVYEVVNFEKINEPFEVVKIQVVEKKQVIPEVEDETLHIANDVQVKEEPIQQKIEKPIPVISQKVELKEEEVEKKAIAINAGKHYMCHQCKGKGSASTDLRCSICEGSGRIEQGHPLIAFLDEVVNDKLKSLLEKYNFAKIEELKKQQFEGKKVTEPTELKLKENGKKQSAVEYSFTFSQPPENRVKSNYDQQFLWSINITNSGSSGWPRRVYVYRIKHGGSYDGIHEINGIMSGQKVNMTLGFKAHKKNGVEMFDLRLGYVDLYEGVVFFGPKFGFELDTRESQLVEKLRDINELLRNKIQDACKFIPNQRHSTNYLVTRIRDLNMAQDTPVEILTDIIATLQ